MNVKFEEGEALILISEESYGVSGWGKRLLGVATTLDGFGILVESQIKDDDDWVIKWVYTTKDDYTFDIYVTISFDGGDEREDHYKAYRVRNYS